MMKTAIAWILAAAAALIVSSLGPALDEFDAARQTWSTE